ncbi:hypothetical protein HDU77_010641 [Chytriomyces hyalinus]|nr:hypothetical protein HDU77_010641 [Chytriomyces hyalinus]
MASLDDDSLCCVFEHLETVSKGTLAVCAGASRQFNRLAARPLCRHLVLDTRIPGGSVLSRDLVETHFTRPQHKAHIAAFLTMPIHQLEQVRQLTIHLRFHPRIRIESPDPFELDEHDLNQLSPTLIKDAWTEFIARCSLIHTVVARIVAANSMLHTLEYIVDVDSSCIEVQLARRFYLSLSRIANVWPISNISNPLDLSNPNGSLLSSVTVKLQLTSESNLASPLYLSPVITTQGSQISAIVIENAEMWVDAQLVQLVASVGPLKQLILKKAMGLSSAFFKELQQKHASSLQELELNGVKRMDDIALFDSFLAASKRLRRLSLEGSLRTWARKLNELGRFDASNLTSLEELNLRACNGFPLAGFHLLAQRCTQLRVLEVGETMFGDMELQAFLHTKNQLTRVDVRNCPELSVVSWGALRSAKRIRWLNLQNCRCMTDSAAINAPKYVYELIQVLPLLETMLVGPIFSAKPHYLDWCALVCAQNTSPFSYEASRANCDRYVELKTGRLRGVPLSWSVTGSSS